MIDALAVLVGVSCGLPIVGALVSVVGWRVPSVRTWGVACGCALGALAAGGGLLWGRFGDAVSFPQWGPWDWLAVGSVNATGVMEMTHVAFGLRFDALALSVLCSGLGALAILAAASARSTEGRSRSAGVLLTAAGVAAAGIVAATSLVQVLALGLFASFAAYLVAGAHEGRVPIGLPGRRVLLAHLVGDGLLVLTLLLAWYRVETLEVDALRGVAGDGLAAFLVVEDEQAARLHRAVLGLIGFSVLGWVVARSAGFPLFGWSNEAARLPLPAAGLFLAVIAPCVVALLPRFAGVFAVAEEVRYVAALTGGLTALLAGLSAAFQPESRSVLGLATASLLGTAVAGLASVGDPTGGGNVVGALSLALVVGPLTAVGWYAIAVGEATGDAVGSAGRSRLLRWVVAGCGGVLISGAFGQNAIVESLLRGEGEGSATLAMLLLGGEVATGFALVRMFVLLERPAADPDVLVVPRRVPLAGRELPLVAGGVTLGLLCAAWLLWDGWWGVRIGALASVGEPRSVLGLGVATLAGVPGGVAAWLLRKLDRDDPTLVVERARVLGRMGRSRFYVDDALQLFVSLPIRGLAQLCRFVDWFVLDGLVIGVPRMLLRTTDASLRPLRNGPVQVGVLTIVLALAVLAAVVVWR